MHTIVLCSFKGGTGKTATTLHLGSALAKFHNKKVLLIDFDSQANLSSALGFGTDQTDTMVPVLQEEKAIQDVIKTTCIPNLDLIPANTYLDLVETTMPLINDPYAHERLRNSLKGLNYDYCFIDIPPSLGWLCQSAFYAAQNSIICCIPQPHSVLALNRLYKYHNAINKHHRISTLGVLFSQWDERGSVNKPFLDSVENVFPNKTFETKIKKDASVWKCVLEGVPVFLSNPKAPVISGYKDLAIEFMARSSAKKVEEAELAEV